MIQWLIYFYFYFTLSASKYDGSPVCYRNRYCVNRCSSTAMRPPTDKLAHSEFLHARPQKSPSQNPTSTLTHPINSSPLNTPKHNIIQQQDFIISYILLPIHSINCIQLPYPHPSTCRHNLASSILPSSHTSSLSSKKRLKSATPSPRSSRDWNEQSHLPKEFCLAFTPPPDPTVKATVQAPINVRILTQIDPALVAQVEAAIKEEIQIVAELNEVASKHPYYKSVYSLCWILLCPFMCLIFCHRYNAKWARVIQQAIGTTIYCGWLGGFASESQPDQVGRLLTLEEVGTIFSGKRLSQYTKSFTASQN